MMENVRKTLKKYYFREIVVYFLVYTMFFSPALALATPSGGAVSPDAGGANITYNTGTYLNTTQVGVLTGQTIIDWTSLNTLGGAVDVRETLAFSQGGLSNSAVLNRVSGTATLFDGTLTAADMRIFIVNPAGLTFGPSSFVEASLLVGSAMNMTNGDFLAATGITPGNMNFSGSGDLLNEGEISAEAVYLVGENVTNTGSISGEVVVLAAGDSVVLGQPGSDVFVEVTMAVPADHVVDHGGSQGTGPGSIDADHVVLAAGDIYAAALDVQTLRAEAHKDITFEGEIAATGNVDLLAARDVQLKEDVETGGDLTITATTGAIDAIGATIYMNTNDKTLTVTQNAGIGMEVDFSVSNSENTDLVANTDGTFTSAAAPQWKSITATADGSVTLNDTLAGGTITAGALTSDTGNVSVSTVTGQVLATDTITAAGSVDITGSSGIVVSADILAGTGITLNNDVTADGVATDQTFDAGGGKLWAKDTITKASSPPSPGNLILGGDAGVDLDGTVDVQTFESTLTITDDFTAAGNLLAKGVSMGTEGIIFKGSTVNAEFDGAGDQVINAGMGGLEATGDIIKTTPGMLTIYTIDGVDLTGGASQRMDNEQGRLHVTSTMPGLGRIIKTASGAGDLTIGGLKVGSVLGVDLNVSVDVQTAGGSLTIEDTFVAASNLLANNGITFKGDDRVDAIMNRTYPVGFAQTIDAGTGILEATGDITKTTNGELIIIADGGVSLTGDSSQTMDNMGGRLWVKDQITKTAAGAGNLTLNGAGTQGIDLDGTVDVQTAGGNLYIIDDFTAAGDLRATHDIWLSEAGELDGTTGTGDQRIEAEDGMLWAMGTLTKTTTGDLYLAGETLVNLDRTVDVDLGSLIIEDDFAAGGDLIANTNITLAGPGPTVVNGTLDGTTGPQRIDAEGGTLWANGTLEKTTSGTLTLAAGTLVDLDGIDGTSGDSVTVAAGDLTIEDDVDAEGHLRASGLIHLQGTNNNLAGDVIATGSDITFDNAVVADGAGSQTFDAGTGTLWAKDTITKTNAGDLTLAGDTLIDLDGTVDVQTTTGSLTIENNFQAKGDLIATQNVTFNGPSNSTVNATLDGGTVIPVNQKIEAEEGKVYANGYIHKTGDGNLDIFGGFDGPLHPDLDYSIFTHAVTVDAGQLDIAGDGYVALGGSI